MPFVITHPCNFARFAVLSSRLDASSKIVLHTSMASARCALTYNEIASLEKSSADALDVLNGAS
jgi:hypothetical protein